MTEAQMLFIGELDGKRLHFADARFTEPGVYYWDGTTNVRVWPTQPPHHDRGEVAEEAREILAKNFEQRGATEAAAGLRRRDPMWDESYILAAITDALIAASAPEDGLPWVPELLEWLEKHDCCPVLPFTDYELIEALEARFGDAGTSPEQQAADYLIESAYNGPNTSWWNGLPEGRGSSFTSDPNEAVRFGRRVDAERVARHMHMVRVTEHLWVSGAALTEAKQQGPGEAVAWAVCAPEGHAAVGGFGIQRAFVSRLLAEQDANSRTPQGVVRPLAYADEAAPQVEAKRQTGENNG